MIPPTLLMHLSNPGGSLSTHNLGIHTQLMRKLFFFFFYTTVKLFKKRIWDDINPFWYSCLRLLVKSALGFKSRVDPCLRVSSPGVIHWGYRLVSTYDLPDSKAWGGGYSGVNFGHLKSEVFHWGGYSGVNFGHLKSAVFHLGGGLSGLKFQKGAFWRIWTKIYCSTRNLLVHHR